MWCIIEQRMEWIKQKGHKWTHKINESGKIRGWKIIAFGMISIYGIFGHDSPRIYTKRDLSSCWLDNKMVILFVFPFWSTPILTGFNNKKAMLVIDKHEQDEQVV